MTDLERAVGQIAFSHGYTQRLLDGIDPADWFRIPAAGVSHVAWQVGHLAYAQYRLALVRIRGTRPADKDALPDDYLRLFAGQTVPDPDASRYPPAAEIRATFGRVHALALRELPGLDAGTLGELLESPHPIAKTKLDSLFWCAAHEMMHAGQIGLLRRQLGNTPLW
jgi:hypothetical protein